MRNSLRLLLDNLPDLHRDIERLTETDVLVGVSEDKTDRNESGPTNAMLAYVHDNGSPARNIPARPFMQPGIRAAKDKIDRIFQRAARAALDGHREAMDQAMGKAGLVAQNSIKAEINEGIPPPLKPGTIKNRNKSRGTQSRRQSENQYLDDIANGVDTDAAFQNSGIKPLINTGQLRNSITYVLRRRGSR